MKNLFFTFVIILSLFSFFYQIYAQSSAGTTPASTTSSSPTSTPTGVKPTNTSAPKSSVPVVTTTPVPPPMTTVVDELAYEPPSSKPLILWIIGIAVALGLGFFGLRAKKTDNKKDDKKCGNIKKLMEDKLDELKDLKGQLTDKAKEKSEDLVKAGIKKITSEELVAVIEIGEKEYARLKALYEKCIASLNKDTPKTTLLFLYKPAEKKILLAMKKRSFGKGKWNGIGGKLEAGESILDALVREAHEEIGVKIDPGDLVQVATLDFIFKDSSDWDQQSHVFFTEKWEGEPTETEEMNPKWHSTDSLPYENMWVDDPNWLPLVLEGKKIIASFNFDKSGSKILDMKIDQKPNG